LIIRVVVSFITGFAPRSRSSSFIETERIHPLDENEPNNSLLKRKIRTRKIWEKNTVLEAVGSSLDSHIGQPTIINSQSITATEKHNQLAKYSSHHVPDPGSRCASRMVGIV
jgi:ABC-type branched-subunit amino acid transport system ATPase component